MKKKVRILLTVRIMAGLLAGCSSHTLYLVRHAEKATTPANDPPLTAEGGVRATATLRIRATAEPLADELGLDTEPYDTDTLWEVAKQLRKLRSGNMLVVGHSNALLPLLDQLPVTHGELAE